MMRKSSTYLLNCGRDEGREKILFAIERKAASEGISKAELIWDFLEKGLEDLTDLNFSNEKNQLYDFVTQGENPEKHAAPKITHSIMEQRPFMENGLGICLIRILLQIGFKPSNIFHINKDIFPRTEITRREIESFRGKLIRRGRLNKNLDILFDIKEIRNMAFELINIKAGQPWSLMEVLIVTNYYFDQLQNNEEFGILPDVIRNIPNRTTKSIEFKMRNISAILRDKNLPFLEKYQPLDNYQKLSKLVVENNIFPNDSNQNYKLIVNYISKNQTELRPLKNKYYVVVKGRNPGIYETWKEAKEQVENYPKANHKSFEKKPDALSYFYSEIEKIIEAALRDDSQLVVSELSKQTGIKQEVIAYVNKNRNLGLKKGYSKAYISKMEGWNRKREEIRNFLTQNPGVSTKKVVDATGANSATVIDEARKSNLELALHTKVSIIEKEKRKAKETKIREYLNNNPFSDAKRVSANTGCSLARIYALAKKEKLSLGKATVSNEIGERNRKRIRNLYTKKPDLNTREIAHETGLSIPTVNQHLNTLGIKRTSLKLRKRRLSSKYERLKGF